jgi:hypothetical protein
MAEEVAQRRREKILARATEEDRAEEGQGEVSAFDRYRQMKERAVLEVSVHR